MLVLTTRGDRTSRERRHAGGRHRIHDEAVHADGACGGGHRPARRRSASSTRPCRRTRDSRRRCPSRPSISSRRSWTTTSPSAEEHITAVRRCLLLLEPVLGGADPPAAAVEELFRSFHSLKGISAMVELREAERLAHEMESCLGSMRDQRFVLTGAGIRGARRRREHVGSGDRRASERRGHSGGRSADRADGGGVRRGNGVGRTAPVRPSSG